MILITGGAFQGKKAYAMEKFDLQTEDFLDGGSCTEEELLKGKAVTDFQEYVRRILQEGREPRTLVELLEQKNPKLLVITNELGSGVIPAEPFDRAWREAAGRVACDIARQASEVHRVICGIGTVIKG